MLGIQNILQRQKKMNKQEFPKEGDVWLVKFKKSKETPKTYRPCLVISNNAQNEFDENIVIVGITSDEVEKIRTFEIFIKNTSQNGLDEPSKICCNYLHTINKKLRLVDKQHLGTVGLEIMNKVKKSLKIVLNLEENNT